MVTIKFIVEVVLVIVTLVIVLWWAYTNYNNLFASFIDWIRSLVG
jgi:hypothetical protein